MVSRVLFRYELLMLLGGVIFILGLSDALGWFSVSGSVLWAIFGAGMFIESSVEVYMLWTGNGVDEDDS